MKGSIELSHIYIYIYRFDQFWVFLEIATQKQRILHSILWVYFHHFRCSSRFLGPSFSQPQISCTMNLTSRNCLECIAPLQAKDPSISRSIRRISMKLELRTTNDNEMGAEGYGRVQACNSKKGSKHQHAWLHIRGHTDVDTHTLTHTERCII